MTDIDNETKQRYDSGTAFKLNTPFSNNGYIRVRRAEMYGNMTVFITHGIVTLELSDTDGYELYSILRREYERETG